MLTRRKLLATSGQAACLLPLLGTAIAYGQASATSPVISTPIGSVRGTQLPGAKRFLGIPFAKPPVGLLRYQAAQDLEPWQGIKDALSYAPSPMQKPLGPKALFPIEPTYSEDALYLNIWTPDAPGPHPVYVFVHGGGNIAGTSSMSIYDGEHFAANGIVYVSITYRVGVFGFLDVSKLLGDAYKGSGNNGLLDQIKALQWIQKNISSFGGDPRNVTIGGQSAGAKNVAALMASPKADGLYDKVISESGGAQTYADQKTAHDLAASFLAALDTTDPKELLTSTPEALLSAQYKVVAQYPRKFPFRSVIDGVVLDQSPLDAIRKGRGSKIPMLLGYNSDEIAFYGPSKTGDGAIAATDIGNMDVAELNQLYAHYSDLYPALDGERRRYKAVTAESYFIPTLRLAEARAKTGATSYLYNFNMAPTAGKYPGLVVHGSELPLVADNMQDSTAAAIGPTGPAADQLAKVMHASWLSFIRTGKPLVSDSKPWPAYDLRARPVMVFDDNVRVVNDLQADERKLWAGWMPVA